MGLFDWLKPNQGADDGSDLEALAANEEGQGAMLGGLNFMSAIDFHMRWKARLENYIHGNSGEDLRVDMVCRDDQCQLGQWIYGLGGDNFSGLDTFSEMKMQHAQFHICAGKVLSIARLGQKDEALRLLQQGDYLRASERVKMLLAKLYVQIAEKQ
jgi:hypothetical protein